MVMKLLKHGVLRVKLFYFSYCIDSSIRQFTGWLIDRLIDCFFKKLTLAFENSFNNNSAGENDSTANF